MSKNRKIANIVLCLIFVSFAIMQLNDPDGWLWFIIYLVVAALCLINNFRTINKGILWVTFIGLLAYSAFHFSLFIDYLQTDNKEEIFGEMVYEKPYLEGSREFLGLLLAALAIFYQIRGKKTQ
ncbi:transmembrane 220 family protein [Seonamhaeicola marinus]|uniref:Transmembrane family 220, helix n=1 Tax=Seonamhaeicola marinus TaxID=1912246 RepID=A0A5D0HZ50_9FLAO|nr:transmembrane 220 family protein [Seonamhaeicola marinus]TYA74772.1 hypothetical protein FUA24_15800 [Seonamhaeicola marinus]